MKAKHFLSWGAALVSLALSVSCGSAQQKRVYLIDERRSVAGSLVSKNGFDPNNVTFSVIGSNGFRTTPEQLNFDPATNRFSLYLPDEAFYKIQTGTLMEQILSMGRALPTLGLGEAGVVGKAEKYVRIEIRPARMSQDKYQVVPYLQVAVPLTRRNLYSGNDVLSLGSGLEIARAGFVKLRVLNEAGAPLSGASVSAVSDGKIASSGGELPLWHEQLLRPIFTTTDADGYAFIGPVDANDLSPYQILAKADGYCHFLSAPANRFSLAESKSPVLVMRACSKDFEGKNVLLPSFPMGLKYFNVTDQGIARQVVHTKDTNVFLRLDSTSWRYRGVRVGIYETNLNYEPKAEPLTEVREVSQFQGEFDLAIPKDFEGRFIIRASRIPGALDAGQLSQEQFPDMIVYGKRSISLPSRDSLMALRTFSDAPTKEFEKAGNALPSVIDYWRNISITSLGGFENVVPGNAGGTFTLSSPLCKEGWEIGFGVRILGIAKRFKPCVNGSATFTAEEAGFIEKAEKIAQLGGRQAWQIFIRNEYGSESEALSSVVAQGNLNEVTVVIDTSAPLLGTAHPLEQLEFFKVEESNETLLTEISRADVDSGGVKFRFKKFLDPEKICGQFSFADYVNANGELGNNAELKNFSGFLYKDELGRIWARNLNFYEPGLQFVRYSLGATEATLSGKPLSEYNSCRTLVSGAVAPTEMPLTSSHLAIPAGTTGDAEFFLRVMDASGQLSPVTKYSIPRCPSASTCWKD